MRYIFLFLLFISVLFPLASASIYVMQGDTLYWGDNADLTGVYGWECTVAWWKGGITTAQWPDRTEEVCYQAHNIAITPERFPAGTWYKWNGKVEGAGNDIAFHVVGVLRPIVITPTPNTTVNVTSNTTLVTRVPTTIITKALIAPIAPTLTALPTRIATPVPTTQASFIPQIPTLARVPVATPTEEVPAEGIIPPTKYPPIPVLIVGFFGIGLVAYWWVRGNF
jgi:hypothetical protein